LLDIEYFWQIAIAENDVLCGTLKIALGEFRFDQQVADSQIDFRPVEAAIHEGHARPVPKL
jgi:hypothetical protein